MFKTRQSSLHLVAYIGMKRAVIQIGGTQHLVAEGDKIFVNRISVKEGDSFDIEDILSIVEDSKTKVGNPTVLGAKVKAKVIKHSKSKKITAAKFKPKKRYYRKLGHRQDITELEIQNIV